MEKTYEGSKQTERNHLQQLFTNILQEKIKIK